MRKIAFARHCRTAWNVACKMMGQEDVPLNIEGRMQAADLGRTFRDSREVRIEHIVTSDLSRATETSYTVAQVLGLPRERVHLDARFREAHLGAFQGMTAAEVANAHGQHILRPPFDFTPFGGESHDQVLTRLLLGLQDAVALAEGSSDVATVLVVSHSWAFEVLFRHLTGDWVKLGNAEWHIHSIS